MFADAKGLLRCKICQQGTRFDSALLVSAMANPCVSCPAGRYRDNNLTDTEAENECTACILGKTSSTVGAKSSATCESCVPGKIGGGAGLCTDCEPGYYSSKMASSSSCTHCPAGKYAGDSGSVTCKDCPPGRYGNRLAETRNEAGNECAGFCAEGHYGDVPGSSSPVCSGPCPKGSYSGPGAAQCSLCPAGRYGNVLSSAARQLRQHSSCAFLFYDVGKASALAGSSV